MMWALLVIVAFMTFYGGLAIGVWLQSQENKDRDERLVAFTQTLPTVDASFDASSPPRKVLAEFDRTELANLRESVEPNHRGGF